MIWALYHRRERPRNQFIRGWVGPVWTFWRIDKGLAPDGMRAPDRSYSSVRSEWVQELKLEAAADKENSRSLLPSFIFQR
jgi:hypothetical protein